MVTSMTPDRRIDPEILLAHADWMRALAVGLLRDPAAADDVVQDATVAALLRAPASDAPLEPWLARVVRNFAFRRRRGDARRAEHEARASGPPSERTPAETLEEIETQRLLLDAVREIDEPLRTTLVMRYFEGKSSAEIARVQRVPPGTVRWRLKRALDELRAKLDSRAGSRDAWAELLAPFAVHTGSGIPSGSAATGDGAGTASFKILAGVLAMNASQVAWTALALAVVGGVAWWSSRVPAERVDVGATVVVPQAESQKMLDTERPAPIAPETRDTNDAARASIAPATSDVKPATAPASAREDHVAIVDARFVDEHGQPWDGVRVVPRKVDWLPDWNPGDGVIGRADGRATLRFDLPARSIRNSSSGNLQIDLVASRSGCATVMRAATLRSGETAHLGDVVLGPAGRIVGRAVDSDGNGVALATIGIAPVDPPADADQTRRHGSKTFAEAPGTHSASDGSFVIEGAAPGATRIWAHADGSRYAWSEVLQVTSEHDVTGVQIVVMPLLSTDWIKGRIVGPDGSPIAHAMTWFDEHWRDRGTASSIRVDANGHFECLVEHEDARYDITARDPQQKFAATTVENVAPGTVSLEIRMHEKRFVTVRVHDAQGEPVAGARFDMIARKLGTNVPAASEAPGKYSMPLPDGAFDLTVSAKGFRSANLRKLDSATMPAEFDVVMQHAPLVRGRVLAGGAPVRGAHVQILRDDPNARETVSGFRCRYVTEWYEPGATCDANGRFELDCDHDHGFWLRATADGFAPGEIGPRDAAQLEPVSEIDIELTKGGAIEGRVLLPDGRDGEGTIVALNHGDGMARTLRAGPKGAFRVDGLAPGSWQVIAAQSEIDPWSTTFSSAKTDAPMTWSCDVRADRTTRYDLDLTKP
jgi:RNA polymerase sigma-70 factor (ECF subfamily)